MSRYNNWERLVVARDNWARLVEAVVRREEIWQMFHDHSRSPSISTIASETDDLTNRFSGELTIDSFRALSVSPSVSVTNPPVVSQAGTSHNYSNGGGLSTATGSSAGLSRFSAALSDDTCLDGEILPTPNLKIYSFADLKNATRNFKADMALGVGSFGTVYKGWVLQSKFRTGIKVAIKKRNHESMQGFEEWQAEVNFLGQLSHPNLIRLLGYCCEDKELLLVYEFMQKGSLENHLFRRSASNEPLSWYLRLRIAIGAARGLAIFHTSEKQVIYRDFSMGVTMLKYPILA